MSGKGQVALITGAAQGLGKGFATTLLQHGYRVALTDVAQDGGEKTLAELKKSFGDDNVIFIKTDVTSEADFENAFKKTKEAFQGVDVVVNNAGVSGETDNTWERCVDINLKGLIRGTRLALKNLRKDKGGRGGVIVNVASAGGLRPQPYGAVYSGTKAGAIMYSKSIAADAENGRQGVKVYTLCPAFVDTALVDNLMETACEGARKTVQEVGIMSVETVAEDFYTKLLKDSPESGAVLVVTKHGGAQFLPASS